MFCDDCRQVTSGNCGKHNVVFYPTSSPVEVEIRISPDFFPSNPWIKQKSIEEIIKEMRKI